MKKLLLLFALITASLGWAQTQQGNFVLETAVLSNHTTPNTGVGFSTVKDGGSVLNVGLNGGYFIVDNLAVKAGLGYGNTRFNETTLTEAWSYRVGAEYNIVGYVPVEIAWTGSSITNANYNPSYLSTQLGYNWFFTDSVAMKPLVRYDISLTDYYRDVLSFGIGFQYYF